MNDALHTPRADELNRSLSRHETVARLSQEAVTADSAGLMRQIVRAVSEALGSEFCGVLELLPGGDSLKLVAGVGWREGVVGHATVPAGSGSQAGFTLTAGEPVVADDLRSETRFGSPPLLLDHAVVSGLSVVIPGRRYPFGVLEAYSQWKVPFTARDGLFLQSVANILAISFQRDQADEARRQRESEYRRVFESQLIGIAFWSSEGGISEANDEFLKMIGYGRDELEAGKVRWVDLTPPEYLHLDYEGLAEVRARGRNTPYEKEYVRKDGSRVPIMIGGAVFEDETDRGVCFALDLSRVKRAERELDRLAKRDRAVLENSWDVISIHDSDGTMAYQSPSIKSVLGYDEHELLGRKVLDYIHPDDVAHTAEQIERVKSAPGPRPPFETRFRHKSGGWRRCECVGTNLLAHPAVHGILFNARDVTGQRQAEEELQRSERRYRTLVTATPQIIWVMTPAGEPGLLHGTGNFFGPDTPVGRAETWYERIHPDDLDRVRASIARALETEQPLRVEYRLRQLDGKWRQMSAQGMPVRDESGRVEEWVGITTDVTETRQLEEQFRQAQKMEAVGQLAGGVAHDFNNLLTIINGYSDLLLANLPPADPMRELLGEIFKAGQRAGTLTRQLLLFSRQQVLEPKVLNLNAVVSDAERMLRRLIGEDVQFATAFAPDLWPVKVDPGQIEQVLLNLCVNARDAMPTGGRLTIETRNVTLDDAFAGHHPNVRPGGYAMLAVSDTGTGMDDATRAHVFEPFFTTKGPGKGTGLGLAVVFGVVKQSDGHIEVYSEVGHGTTFKLYFPRVRERAVAGKSSPGLVPMPRGTETVLLAEDDEAVRALARHILKGCGYTVLEAGDGREALRAAEGHRGPLDLLISDVVMPHFGGRQLAEKIAEVHPGLKVLFLSGYTDDAVVRHGVLEAEFAFLQKPFTPSGLAVKVRDVLDGGTS